MILLGYDIIKIKILIKMKKFILEEKKMFRRKMIVFLTMIFVLNSIFAFGGEYGKVHTKAEKIQSIDRQIEELLKQKADLELMKKRISESPVDINLSLIHI